MTGTMGKGKGFPRIAAASLLAAGLLLTAGPVPAQQSEKDRNIVEREAAEKARKIGFGDLEVDNLHGQIARKLTKLLAYPTFKQDYPKLKRSHLDFMVGEDREKKTYYRVRLRAGNSFSVEQFPVRYIFRAHCFLYPTADGKGLEKIIFQFYRINFSGTSYVRELRRMIHPNPKDLVGGDPLKAGIQLLDNSKLLLEQYEEPSYVKPTWEGPDGIPLPIPVQFTVPDGSATKPWLPKQRVELNNPKNLVPYDKQVRILARYKRLLRRIDLHLNDMIRVRELDRRIRIEKIMDFPG